MKKKRAEWQSMAKTKPLKHSAQRKKSAEISIQPNQRQKTKLAERMMKLTENHNRSCGSFSGLLTIAFIVLKLCHVIEWSWWWVLSPLWIGAIIVVVCAIIVAAHDL